MTATLDADDSAPVSGLHWLAAPHTRPVTWETVMSDATGIRRLGVAVLTAALSVTVSSGAAAQTTTSAFEAGGEVDTLRLSESRIGGIGVGATAKWTFTRGWALDGLVSLFPASWQTNPATRVPSQRLMLALAGVRPAVMLGRVTLSARARAGVLDFQQNDQPFPCIRIFPAPLECQLPGGYTATAFELGGEADLAMDQAGRLRLRVGGSDLMVRYGLQAIRRNGLITDGFISHNLLMTAGVGWRF